MLHCDGTDGSHTFTDDSASSHTVSALGDVEVDTAQKVFGTGSAMFNPSIDSNTKLLLHFNEADGSTSISDSSPSGHSVSNAGNVQTDDAQGMFSTNSSLFDGTGDYWSVADSADWDFGTGDFTIDFWVRHSILPSNAQYQAYVDIDTFNTGVELYLYNDGGNAEYPFPANMSRCGYAQTTSLGAIYRYWLSPSFPSLFPANCFCSFLKKFTQTTTG